MLLCVLLHKWLSVLLKVLRGFSLCLIYFFLALHCVMCAYVSNNSCTTKCQGTNTYAHIMIFVCTLTFRHSIPTYISRGFFWGQIFITWWLRKIQCDSSYKGFFCKKMHQSHHICEVSIHPTLIRRMLSHSFIDTMRIKCSLVNSSLEECFH
jgi:hypothetical protein